jgi:replicative DNA helicase
MSPLPKRPKKFTGFKKPVLKSPAERAGLTGQARASASKPTLWPSVDATEIAFRPGELSLVVGRSAHGKSNFLLNLLRSWLDQDSGQRIFYYSLEMTPLQSAARLLSMLLAQNGVSISSTQALRFLRAETAPAAVAAGIARLRRLEENLSFVYEPLWDVERLAADIVAKGAKDVGAIFVDSITALSAPPERARQDRRDLELSHISRRLKEIAVRLNCPVIAAAPTRPLKSEEGEQIRSLIANGREFGDMEMEDAIRARRPRLNHLLEATLEQESDLVIGLLSYLSDFQQEIEPDHRALFTAKTKGLLEVSALKNRLGPLESAELEMDSKTSLIRDNPELKSV